MYLDFPSCSLLSSCTNSTFSALTSLAASLLNAMDLTANPCEDFFQFACGTWNKKHVIPEDRSSISTFEVMADELQIILKGKKHRMTMFASIIYNIQYRGVSCRSPLEKREKFCSSRFVALPGPECFRIALGGSNKSFIIPFPNKKKMQKLFVLQVSFFATLTCFSPKN